MSELSSPQIPAESQHEHLPYWGQSPRPLALLQKSSDAGCKVCKLLVNCLGSFYGPWIFDQAEAITVFRTSTIGGTVRVWVRFSEGTSFPASYACEATSIIQSGHVELVFELKDSTRSELIEPVEYESPILGGRYTDLKIRAGRRLPKHPRQNIELMQDWIKECIQSHPRCQFSGPMFMPKRVIMIGTTQDPSLRLHETDDEFAEYAALSHRWGTDRFLTTTRDSLEDRKTHIDESSLSRTFQDAIILVRRLGLKFLWIDSLCIIQDDIEDWQVEASRMASIYERAYVTIAANNTSGGLLEGNALRMTHATDVNVQSMGEQSINIMVRPPIQHENFYAGSLEGGMAPEDEYPLLQRAWCFQERLLATRVLQFTDTEVVFECKTGHHCECDTINQRSGTPIKSLFSNILGARFDPKMGMMASDPWAGWTTILRPYITKDLTVSTDILPALAGVAVRMQGNELGRYVAGLWETELATGLFWFADIMSAKEPPTMTGPTFSWTVLAGTVKVKELQWPYTGDFDDRKQTFQVVDIQCSIDGLNPYGTVSSASITLRGSAIRAILTSNGIVGPKRGKNCMVRCGTRQEPALAFMDTGPIESLHIHEELTCFFGFTWSQHDSSTQPWGRKQQVAVLLLQPLGDGNSYKRVGCIPYLHNDPSWLDLAQEMDLVLV